MLTSPTATPTSLILTGKLLKILSATFFNPSKLSPVAPVFLMIVSYPSSISRKANVAAAPTATIGAVTFFDRVVPTEDIFSPVSLNLPPTSLSVACIELSVCFSFSVNLSSSCSVAIISLFNASNCFSEISPFASAVLACSSAILSVSNFFLVSSMAVFKSSCF